MDRSFLFSTPVIEASRGFVCVRLVTYEDPTEAAFLKGMSHTRSGDVENSAFSILAPDCKTKLVGAGRGIQGAYADASAMAEGMRALLKKYTPKAEVAALPLTEDVRIGLDVAASDNQPFVVLVAKNDKTKDSLEKTMARLAWRPEFIGRFIYASTLDTKELAHVEGVKADSLLLVVQPDIFGLKGKVLAQCSSLSEKELSNTLADGAKTFVVEGKTLRTQIQKGQEQGVYWKTEIPVTDPGEAAARERTLAKEKKSQASE